MAVSLREATYTYGNVVVQEAFTISLPSENHVKEADYFGMISGRDVDKFAKTGLTAVKSDLVNAPYIEEFPLVIECKLLHTFNLGLHTQFVGEIMDVKVDEAVLGEDGLPDLEKVRPILFAPENRAYHGIGGYCGKAFSIGREIMQA
jgi:flavin reductase (DIM6/NTAB) family NADH-FMN oxidoreductase RutF